MLTAKGNKEYESVRKRGRKLKLGEEEGHRHSLYSQERSRKDAQLETRARNHAQGAKQCKQPPLKPHRERREMIVCVDVRGSGSSSQSQSAAISERTEERDRRGARGGVGKQGERRRRGAGRLGRGLGGATSGRSRFFFAAKKMMMSSLLLKVWTKFTWQLPIWLRDYFEKRMVNEESGCSGLGTSVGP